MTFSVEQTALRHAHQLCLGHRDDLLDALAGLGQRGLAYPETPTERFSRRQPVIQAARRLLEILSRIGFKLERRFADMAG